MWFKTFMNDPEITKVIEKCKTGIGKILMFIVYTLGYFVGIIIKLFTTID